MTDASHPGFDTLTRRSILAIGAATGILLITGCSSDSAKRTSSEPVPDELLKRAAPPPAPAPTASDLDAIAPLVLREHATNETYAAIEQRIRRGDLAGVPPALIAMIEATRKHHDAHAAAWNEVLSKNGRATVNGVDDATRTEIDAAIAQLDDAVALGHAMVEAELSTGDYYLSGLASISDRGTLAVAATIRPTELQKAALWRFMFGEEPIPAAFA